MVDELARGLPRVTQMQFIADESTQVANSCLQRSPTPLLPLDEAVAVGAYSYDLGFNSQCADGEDNLFVQLNVVLRQRNAQTMRLLKPFLTYLMRGLTALPPFEGKVLRGIPASNLAIIQQHYAAGIDVHWSAFTSTTTSLDTAKQFAGPPGGVIISINVLTGRRIAQYSAIPNEEEVLLSPNCGLIVANAVTLEVDGYYYLEMVERRGEGYIF
mmetsp:Transcript_22197/g.48250  ORF Transcript_22197/g.48250 Transcript_22197/m.48250 type:complete len:214 (-) Transcript_22197:30-671(-)